MRLPAVLVSLCLVPVLSSTAAFASSVTFFGTPRGGLTRATGINGSGQIVGAFNVMTNPPPSIDFGQPQGFLRDHDDFSFINIPGATETSPLRINDPGQIVGSYIAGGITQGFRLDAGVVTTINVPGATSTIAEGINASGQIVGTYIAGGIEHGFLLDSGVFTTLEPPGASSSEAHDINDRGQVVGSLSFPSSSGLGSHAYLLDQGVFSRIDVPGAAVTSARGINNSGDIVGEYSLQPFGRHGYVRAGGAFTTIDPSPGVFFLIFSDINDAGEIVGYFQAATNSETAFLSVPSAAPVRSELVFTTGATGIGIESNARSDVYFCRICRNVQLQRNVRQPNYQPRTHATRSANCHADEWQRTSEC